MVALCLLIFPLSLFAQANGKLVLHFIGVGQVMVRSSSVLTKHRVRSSPFLWEPTREPRLNYPEGR